MIQRIQQLATEYHPWVVAHRRHLHQHPELSGEERQTQAYIAGALNSLGIPYRLGVGGGYSVIADIEGRNPGKKVVALRGDCDALPIFEKNDTPYKSQNQGVMHACGHDAHTSNLLGTGRILWELRHEFEGTVRLIFQPHEEKLPGGAPAIIAGGGLEGVSGIVGLHVDPYIPVGSLGFRPNAYMASVDEIYVTITGKGAHGGASVHQSIDPVMTQAQLLVALSQIKTHNADARIPTVLSFGKVEGGHATNVIPDTVVLWGTFRTVNEEWRAKAHQRMLEIAQGVSLSTGAKIDFVIEKGYPALVNDEALTLAVRSWSAEYAGEAHIQDLDIWMASEDFAYYGAHLPACFLRLGVRNEARGITSGLHTATFDLDEDSLRLGMGILALSALRMLE